MPQCRAGVLLHRCVPPLLLHSFACFACVRGAQSGCMLLRETKACGASCACHPWKGVREVSQAAAPGQAQAVMA